MKTTICSLSLLTLLFIQQANLTAQESLACPFEPSQAAAVLRVLEKAGIEVEATEESYGFVGQSTVLEAFGFDRATLKPWAVHKTGEKALYLLFVYDENGQVLSVGGNGPWLPNAALQELAALPELRFLSLDHNVRPELGWDHPDFDGSAFGAFGNSKLTVVKIGGGFGNEGLKGVAAIPSLRELQVVHSRIKEEGLEVLRGNSGLTSLTISEMGKMSPQALQVFSTIPNLKKMGFGEALATYEGGLEYLKPLAGQLEQIDLPMCVIPPDDLMKLQADHPQAKINTNTPEEMVKIHSWVANQILIKAGLENGEPLAIALMEAGKLEPQLQKLWADKLPPSE